MKDNDTPMYVSVHSNHPRNIIKNIPLGINNRLSRISANEEVFNDAAAPYQRALEKSGYTHKLEFKPPNFDKPKKKCRKREFCGLIPPSQLM